jgi:hypothetical protein
MLGILPAGPKNHTGGAADADQRGRLEYDKYGSHAVFPPGVTAEMIAANPEASRPDWVKPPTFWTDHGANWLPAPADQFCLAIRAYIPDGSILDGSYQFPDIERAS